MLGTFAVLMPLLLVACGEDPTAPTGPPDVVGEIVEIDSNTVRIRPDELCGPYAVGYVFRVTSATYLSVGGRRASLDDLPVGATAEAWWAGFVAQSCPPGGAAEAIIVP
jgi:hypothetical protein